jgi:hypothetical protein
MTEQWKDIEGYEGKYQVSSNGRIRSMVSLKVKPYLIRSPRTRRDGYLDICLKVKGKTKCFLIHVLVARAFVDGRSDGLEVNHLDGNKANNDSENLEWCSHQENAKHANDCGLRKPPSPDGHRFSKLSSDQVNEIRNKCNDAISRGRFHRGELSSIAKKYNVNPAAIRAIAKEFTWKR